ncbi:hypothetical protein PIB30_114312, partial [Stylosanthes scabra]|nr:hypothetical protein [Stylosanthes scabra]
GIHVAPSSTTSGLRELPDGGGSCRAQRIWLTLDGPWVLLVYLVMPDDAPAPRRRQPQVLRPRQAAPVRGKLSSRDQRRRLRMVEMGAAPHIDEEQAEEQAEEQREYDRQDEPVDGGDAQFQDDHQDPSISPSGMISFSPDAARAFPSPAR